MAAILPLHLPDHLPTLLISTVGFAAIHHLGAPEFARFLLGKKGWDALGSHDRVGWCVFFPCSPIVRSINLELEMDLARSLFVLLDTDKMDACTDCYTLHFIGNRAWYRSSTRCSFSPWPHAISIFLPSRPIARLGGTHASAPSLPSRAGKKSNIPRELPLHAHGSYTPHAFFGSYFLWDAIVCLVHYEGIGFVIHGTRPVHVAELLLR